MIPFLQQINRAIIPHRKAIIGVFIAAEWAIVLLTAAGFYSVFTGTNETAIVWYDIGAQMGELALYVFFVTITAGILRRFGLLQPIQQLLMLFRRHLGIMTYLLGMMHWVLVRIAFAAKQGVAPALATFEIPSFIAMQVMFVMFVTSNDWSVKRLGVWWKRLHKLIYIVAWLLFFHVALQIGEGRSKALIAFVFAAAELASLIYDAIKKRKARQLAAETAQIEASMVQ